MSGGKGKCKECRKLSRSKNLSRDDKALKERMNSDIQAYPERMKNGSIYV